MTRITIKSCVILLSLSPVFLSSCSLLSPVKTDNYTTYVLNTTPCVMRKSYHPITLFVTPVEADSLYNTDDMAYSAQCYQVDYFAKNKWADTPARMLQPLILQTLRCTHHFHAITTSPNVIKYDYVLNTKIQELRQIFLCDSSYVIFKLHAEIINARNGRIVASKDICVMVCACQSSPYGGVVAENRAVAIALRKLATFITNRI